MISFSPFPVLQTERLDLRPYSLADQEAIFFLRSDPAVNEFVNRPKPKNLEEVGTFIKKIQKGIADNEMISWGIYEAGSKQLIGSIGYWQFNAEKTTADIGYELHPAHWRKGYMQEAFVATLPYAFGPMALEKIEAWVNVDNIPSIRLLEKNDFKKVRRVPKGEAGDPYDMFIYALEA